MPPILVIGAGGHGKVVLDALLAAGHPVLGLADGNPALLGQMLLDHPVLGGDDFVLSHEPSAILLANGVGSVVPGGAREAVYARFRAGGYRFTGFVHPFAYVARDVELADGVQVMAGVVLQPGCRIGSNSLINTRAAIDHDCVIGCHVHVAPGVTMSGTVTVGDRVHIGTGASVIHGVTIGDGALIGAGAVVVRDVPAGARVLGVPARERG